MLNYRSKPSQDSIFIEIAIWGADLVLCSAPEFGPHPGGSYGGQGGLSFYVGAKSRQWSKISNRKLEISIVVKLASQPDSMLNEKRNVDTYKNNFVNSYRKNIELNENFHSTIHKSFQRKRYFRNYVYFFFCAKKFCLLAGNSTDKS